MNSREYAQKDHEYGKVLLDALALQHSCELAGMPTQARQVREIRRQAAQRLQALSAHRTIDVRD